MVVRRRDVYVSTSHELAVRRGLHAQAGSRIEYVGEQIVPFRADVENHADGCGKITRQGLAQARHGVYAAEGPADRDDCAGIAAKATWLDVILRAPGPGALEFA
jgi:hypothetical protein